MCNSYEMNWRQKVQLIGKRKRGSSSDCFVCQVNFKCES